MPESSSESKRVPGAKRLERLAVDSSSNRGKAYQGALEAVFSIVIATLLGYWADQHFGTSPRYLITGAVVGFSSFVLRLVRMASLVEPMPAAGEAKEEETTSQAKESSTGPASGPVP
jgi:F0F1-type ATP synthase assembly protein I